MSRTFSLEIITPICGLSIGDVNYVRCPGLDGSFGVMPNHREGIIALNIGEIKIMQNGKDEYYATGGGFVEILEDGVKLLVESVEKSSDINTERAELSLDRAQKRKTSKDLEIDETRVEASLVRALNRLKVSKR